MLALTAAFWLSPWPSALLIRWAFDRGGAVASAALLPHVPDGIVSDWGLRYDDTDPDALLDVHRPADLAESERRAPVIVWIHGGGFVAGSRRDVANYAKILAADGYVVAAVDYSLAPGARYPVPVHQVNRALAWLSANAERLRIDPGRFVLAGDSAGAHIAAQAALLATSPGYAGRTGMQPGLERGQLIGMLLFCGLYDTGQFGTHAPRSWFIRTVMWSYLGSTSPPDQLGRDFSVVANVTAGFPPSFVTVGNGDPLAPHSHALVRVLAEHGVRADSLFFPDDLIPPLPHEYQFNLDREEGREALRRVRAFLATL